MMKRKRKLIKDKTYTDGHELKEIKGVGRPRGSKTKKSKFGISEIIRINPKTGKREKISQRKYKSIKRKEREKEKKRKEYNEKLRDQYKKTWKKIKAKSK